MKKLFLILAIALLLTAIPATVFLVGQRQEIRKKAAPATTARITPSQTAKKAGDTFTMEVAVDTGENQVVAAEIHLTFDPAKLEAQTITNGALFPNILVSGTVEAGTASITVGAADVRQPVKGSGTMAVVKFKALAKTDSPTVVKLAPNTYVGGLGEGATNVLVGTTPATVTIAEGQLTATATPTPISTPVVSPYPSATGSATPALTPKPSATQSATQSPQSSKSTVSESTLTIIAPAQESTTTVDTPTIRGKADPGATVTVTVYSTPRTVTVTADSNGNWSYMPDEPLEEGPHNIVASVTDESGQMETATSAFVVAATSERVIPVSGTVETTLFLLFLGSTFVIIGVFLFSHSFVYW